MASLWVLWIDLRYVSTHMFCKGTCHKRHSTKGVTWSHRDDTTLLPEIKAALSEHGQTLVCFIEMLKTYKYICYNYKTSIYQKLLMLRYEHEVSDT